MPAWNNLPSDEFRAVASYAYFLGHAPDLAAADMVAPAPVLMVAGRRVFEADCVRCHGEDLSGNGPDAFSYNPRPANFHEVLPSYSATLHVLRYGVPGSGMAAWPLLTPAETQAVTYYMRSFYQGPHTIATKLTSEYSKSMEAMQ